MRDVQNVGGPFGWKHNDKYPKVLLTFPTLPASPLYTSFGLALRNSERFTDDEDEEEPAESDARSACNPITLYNPV